MRTPDHWLSLLRRNPRPYGDVYGLSDTDYREPSEDWVLQIQIDALETAAHLAKASGPLFDASGKATPTVEAVISIRSAADALCAKLRKRP